MRRFLDRILRAPDDGAGGGAPPPAASEPAAPAVPAASPPTATPAPAAAAAPAPAGGATSGPYHPEGLPGDWVGETDKDTIDRIAKVAKGYRERDSKAGVPDDPAEYRQFGEIDEKLKPYYGQLEGDGMFDDIAGVAKEHGVPKAAFQAIIGKFMSSSAELGILEPPVDKAAEREALLPEAARGLPKAAQDQAIDRRMNDNLGWIDGMKSRGLSEESADHMIMMLGDSAKGHQAIEFFRAQLGGAEAPRPGGSGDGGGKGDPKADLSRRMALPENTPGNPKFDKASYDQLDADYKRIHGD